MQIHPSLNYEDSYARCVNLPLHGPTDTDVLAWMPADPK
jgi:hypothetical protein